MDDTSMTSTSTAAPADRVATVPAPSGDDDATTTEIVDELLVEEISIDGMCGVY
jgi:mycofactocin precursor